MVEVYSLYLDDSGTRHPTNKPGKKAEHGYDWFALGGVLIREEDEDEARRQHEAFLVRWPSIGETPLHSSEIRSQNEGYGWLRGLAKDEAGRFYEELYCLMRDAPVVGIACVIDRPGYNDRYLEKFEQNPWMLCKSAFSMVVERAAKVARQEERKLRVFVERCNKTEDRMIQGYYDTLRKEGHPFAVENAGKYAPLTQEQFAETLYDLKFKRKSSPMAQLADLYLWPMCVGGYHVSNRPFKRLMSDGKLIETRLDLEAIPTLGSKYFCFDKVERRA